MNKRSLVFLTLMILTCVAVYALFFTVGPQIGMVFSSIDSGLGGDGSFSDTAVETGTNPGPARLPVAAPGDMFFADYGENRFINTGEDPLSTFAMDVDSGSYTIARSYLTDGLLPPQAAVRTEEFINYFEQNYPIPSREETFTIHLEGAPSPYGEEGQHLLQIGIQGYELPPEERPDALLIFVIDVSGSMGQQNRLDLVKESLQLLVGELRPLDQIGLVTYGTQAQVVLEPTFVHQEEVILTAIARLRPEGSTNAAEGILKAYQLAANFGRPGQITRLILCSDGVANVGPATAEEILAQARGGVSLSTFGFGMGNYNDVLMEQLADQGDGSYSYIDTIYEAERLFVSDLNGTLLTIAEEAKIQVDFNPAVVASYRLLGYENRAVADEDFRDDSVDGGEIGAGHAVTALYEVVFVEEAAAAETALTVYIRYTDAEQGEVIELAESVHRGQFHDQLSASSPHFQLTAQVAEFAEILRGSYWARGNDLPTLAEDTQVLLSAFPDDEAVQEFANLVAKAAVMGQG